MLPLGSGCAPGQRDCAPGTWWLASDWPGTKNRRQGICQRRLEMDGRLNIVKSWEKESRTKIYGKREESQLMSSDCVEKRRRDATVAARSVVEGIPGIPIKDELNRLNWTTEGKCSKREVRSTRMNPANGNVKFAVSLLEREWEVCSWAVLCLVMQGWKVSSEPVDFGTDDSKR